MAKGSTKSDGLKGLKMNRRTRRAISKHLKKINLNAAGIDIGSKEHYVAVPEDRAKKPVRSFGCFTTDLIAMADWFEECEVDTIVMESTGVYWVPVYQVLEDRGFDVLLVDAHHVKNVPGRKSDVMDCQWLQELHTYGLLSSAFIPDKDVGYLRTLWRHRSSLVECCARQIHLMQKSLDLMNLHLHKVLADITGVTGMAIIRAIMEGERDPMKLAKMKNYQVKASEEDIAKALTGYYREEHLFTLKQALDAHDFYQGQLNELDEEIESYLSIFDSQADPDNYEKPEKTKNRSRRKNEPHFDLHAELYRICGVDLTKIDGLDALTVMTIISEIGLDMSKFPTEKKLASYLGLCPNNRKTGGKVKNTKSKKVKNRASKAFRLAAQSLHSSKSALGAYYRRMRYRLGAPKAITAAANKLCRIFYRLLKYGEEYVDVGMDAYEKQYQERVMINLKKRAHSMGFQLVNLETGEVVS
jgi:transposase